MPAFYQLARSAARGRGSLSGMSNRDPFSKFLGPATERREVALWETFAAEVRNEPPPAQARIHEESEKKDEGYGFGSLLVAGLVGAVVGGIGVGMWQKNVLAKGVSLKDYAKSFKNYKLHKSFFEATRDPGTGRFLTINGHRVEDQFGPVVAWYDEDEGVYKVANVVTGKKGRNIPRGVWSDSEFRDEIAPSLDHETGKALSKAGAAAAT